MRRGLDDLGVRACLLGNLVHYTHEVIQRLASLRLGWLDHQRLMYDQREVDGWRVHAKVEDTLGNVERRDTILLLLAFSRGNELMLAHLRIGDLVVGRQLVSEVVRIQNGTLRNMQQTIGSIGTNVGVRAHHYTEVALIGTHFAD